MKQSTDLSILPCISKVMECVVNNQMCAYFQDILDIRLSNFRKNYKKISFIRTCIKIHQFQLVKKEKIHAFKNG